MTQPTKTLQDFLGADFVDRDERTPEEKRVSLLYTLDLFERMEFFRYEVFDDFVVVKDYRGEDLDLHEFMPDMTRAILPYLDMPNDAACRAKLPLAVLGDVNMLGVDSIKHLRGSLQYIGGKLRFEAKQKIDWTGCPVPQGGIEMRMDVTDEGMVAMRDRSTGILVLSLPELQTLAGYLHSLPFTQMPQPTRPMQAPGVERALRSGAGIRED